ncbi:MAG: Ig domain-containing protein [Lachnospiraceae bacterium]|nr:Ig domain-containing protein [Lachnospiraceae bacterium]
MKLKKKLKKKLLITSVALCLSAFFGAPNFEAHAQEDTVTDVDTTVTYVNGATDTVDSVVYAEGLEAINMSGSVESYEISIDNEPVLLVETVNVQSNGDRDIKGLNGYYAVTFDIPGTTKECYLTGLTAAAVDDICDRIIANNGDNVSFSSLDIIDAEKKYDLSGGDNLLCWAASASNMLHYSGWGAAAGFSSEDEIFDLFAEHFVDDGFFTIYGISWFMTGTTLNEVDNRQKLKDYKNSGAFLKEYDFGQNCEYIYAKNNWENVWHDVVYCLKSGCAVGLGVLHFEEDKSISDGHALTLCGVIIDKSLSEDEKGYYDSIIVTDSDNSRPATWIDERALMDNSFTLCKLSPFEDIELDFDTFSINEGVIDEFTILKPYSEAVKKETDEKATLDRYNTSDLAITDIIPCNNNYCSGDKTDKVLAGDIYLFPVINNFGDVKFEGSVPYDVSLYDAAGNLLQEWHEDSEHELETEYHDVNYGFKYDNIRPGTYKVKAVVNGAKDITEALYINNEFEKEFTVVENYEDVAAMGITAEIDPVNPDDLSAVRLEYNGIIGSELIENCKDFKLEASYLDFDGYWSDYDDKSFVYPEDMEPGTLPETFFINADRRSKVCFRLTVRYNNKIKVCFETPEYDVKSYAFNVVFADGYPNDAIEISPDAKSVDENLSFHMINPSKEDMVITYRIVAVPELEGDEIELKGPQTVALKSGEQSDEIYFNSWDTMEDFPCSVSIVLKVEYSVAGEKYTDENKIMAFLIKEKASPVVTTAEDIVDAFDGLTSIREALEYAKTNPGSKITFADGVDEITLQEPLKVDGRITIDGTHINADGKESFVSLSGGNKTQCFVIDKTGELNINNMSLVYGNSDTNGGAILVNGGTLIMNKCLFALCKTKYRGGAVYADGAKVMIKNTSFFNCQAASGGAICTNNKADVELLNCSFQKNSSGYGVIYNNSSRINVINSTVVALGDQRISYYNFVIMGGTNTNVINSIIVDDWLSCVCGPINVIASLVTGEGTGTAMFDSLCRRVECISDISIPDYYYGVETFSSDDSPVLLPLMNNTANEGYLLSVSGGEIIVSGNGADYVRTGIKTSFTNEDFETDIAGYKRIPCFGCYTLTRIYLDELEVTGIEPQIYTGKAIEPAIVIKDGDYTLKPGTDYEVSYENNVKAGTATVTITGMGLYTGSVTLSFNIVNASVSYRAYVQKKNWMKWVKDGVLAGTTDNLRMETIQLKLNGAKSVQGGIKYRAYVQKLGWTFWADTAIADSYAGTKGKSLRIEAVQIKPYGELANMYDVYYKVYTDKYKWLDWTKNGKSAGTSGLAYKLRGFEVKLVEKGAAAPGKTTKPYATNKNP